MRRRDFLKVLSATAAAWPMVGRAQHSAMPVIGFLNAASPDGLYARFVTAFRNGLGEIGYVEGQNVQIEFRWADGHTDRLPGLAAELVKRQVTVIAATSTPAGPAAKAATSTIPIVFTTGGDPVQMGLVASLNRLGGNVTGVTSLTMEIAPKRLELLHECMPKETIIALLRNSTHRAAEAESKSLQDAARKLGLQLHVLHAATERDFDTAFTKLSELQAKGLVIGNDPFFTSRAEALAALAIRHAVPTVFQDRAFAAAGGLISYGASLTEVYRHGGIYVGRILKGEKPGTLPVQQATGVELIVNLKTAKALGLAIPTSLLVRADEVIE